MKIVEGVTERCVFCGEYKEIGELVKITADRAVFINETYIICYSCIHDLAKYAEERGK